MLYGLIGLKFCEESDLDLFWTRVGLVLIHVRLVLTRVRVGLMLTSVGTRVLE